MATLENEAVKFINEHSSLVLEVEGESMTEGTRVEQYTDTGGDHQQWRLKPAGPGNEGFYNIENVRSGLSMEVVGYSDEPGAEIVQRAYGPGPLHRQWELIPVVGKTDVYKLSNRYSGLVLDDVDGQTDAPAPVKQYESWNDDGRQQWRLVLVSTTETSSPAVATPPAPTPAAPTPPAPTPAAAAAAADVLKYGDKVTLRNGGGAGWLCTYGGAPAPNKHGVFTRFGPNSNSYGDTTWEIVSATGKAVGTEVLLDDSIHLRNLYHNNGGYLDTYGHVPSQYAAGGFLYNVYTHESRNRASANTGLWRILQMGARADSKVREEDPVCLVNGYQNWFGGFLAVSGGSAPNGGNTVMTNRSHSPTSVGSGSGTWRFHKI